MQQLPGNKTSKPKITIAKAVPQDAQTLARIKQRIWLDTYQNKELRINADDIFAKDFLCKERIAKRAEHMQVNDGINYTLVARAGEHIVGYGRAIKGDEFDEIATLYILPEWQSMGIGSDLLSHLLEWLGGNRDVKLGVVQYNLKAIRFYEKFCFTLGKKISHAELTFSSGKDLPEVEMLKPKEKSHQ
ncbi:MAG: GNAT family N-acetyltransferase [Candidatus Levyibacteriota bacterium]